MQKYLVITIDVEPDCSHNWLYSKPLTFNGIHTGIGKRLQPLFNKYDAKPTYLLNNVVMEDKRSVAFFKKLGGRYELGTHLHPEFIAPEKKYDDYAGKKGSANCCQYSPHTEFKKLENITNLFTRNFEYRPTSFRAGRFAAAENTIRSLIDLGYKVDTSVTPHVCWREYQKIRNDFRYAPEQPYFVNNLSITKENVEGPLLEVPVSIVPAKFSLFNIIRKSIAKRKLSRLPPVWLRPAYSDANGFTRVIDYLSKQYASAPKIVYNVMFHNIEVLPNINPYTRSEAACTLFLNSIEWLLSYCRREGIEVVGLSDLYNIYRHPDTSHVKSIKIPASKEESDARSINVESICTKVV